MKVSKIFNYIFATIGFLYVASLCVLLAIYLIIPKKNHTYFFATTGSFVKQCVHDTSHTTNNEPCICEKFRTHLKLAYKMGNTPPSDTLYTENICGFTVKFPSYSMIHSLFDEIFVHKIYGFTAQTDTPFIIDAGSNIGMSICYFKMIYPNAKILGFEPSKQCFAILQDTVKTNNLSDVELVKKGLSNKEETVTFYDAGPTKGTLTPEGECSTYASETIETTLLSKYINQKVDLLKMDIEGAETGVFDDLFKSKKIAMIDQIIFEFHYTPGTSKLSEILNILEESGFVYIIKNHVTTPFAKVDSRQYFMVYAYRA